MVRERLIPGLRLLGAVWVTLWVTDVVFHLDLLARTLARQPLASRPSDFLGLALADLLPATAIALTASIIAAIPAAGRVLRAGGEPVTVAAALVGGLVAQHGMAREFGDGWLLPSIVTVSMVIVLLWLGSRRLLAETPSPAPGSLAWVQGAGLVSAALVASLAGLTRSPRTGWALLGVAVFGALGWWAARPDRPRRVGWAWLPSLLAGGLAAISVASFAALGSAFVAPSSSGDTRPDIVLIVLDTVRADHLELYGYQRDTMPELRRWSQQTRVAERAVAPGGWTRPTHASIFSGLTVSQHGVHYASRSGVLNTRPRDGVAWLPRRLATDGYLSLAVTANQWAIPEGSGFGHVVWPARLVWGEDATLGASWERRLRGRWPLAWSERLNWRRPYVGAEGIADIAMRAGSAAEGSFFLFVNFMDAHSPYNPPAWALDALGITPAALPFSRYATHREMTGDASLETDGAPSPGLVDLYDGELRALDAQLKRLLEWIDTRLGPDTIVIVTSDHGEELGEEGRVGHEYGLAQSVVHVPLLVRADGLAPGSVNRVVSLQGLYGFVTALAGGDSATDAWRSAFESLPVVSERYPSAYHARTLGPAYDRAWLAMFDGPFKVVGPSEYGATVSRLDSFDRELPAEQVLSNPQATALIDAVDRYWQTERDPREADDIEERLTEDELRKLRALGYFQ